MVARSPTIGVVLMLLAALLFAVVDGLAKWLTNAYSAEQVMFIRFAVGFCVFAVLPVITGRMKSLKVNSWSVHISRAVFGLGMMGSFVALRDLPLLEFSAIFYTAPLVLALISPWYLNERLRRTEWLMIALGFMGVLLVLKPTTSSLSWGHLGALSAMVSYSAMMATAKKHANTESSYALNLFIYPLAMVVSGHYAVQNWLPLDSVSFLKLLGFSLLTTFTVFLVFRAMRYAQASLLAPLEYTQFIWTGLIGWQFFAHTPDGTALVGLVLICISGGVIAKRV